eukprot:scaffold245615_cov37-Tisochrysis_lutea.AAC.1
MESARLRAAKRARAAPRGPSPEWRETSLLQLARLSRACLRGAMQYSRDFTTTIRTNEMTNIVPMTPEARYTIHDSIHRSPGMISKHVDVGGDVGGGMLGAGGLEASPGEGTGTVKEGGEAGADANTG